MQDRFKFRIWNGSEMHYNDFVVTATGFVGKITEEFLGKCVFNQEDLTADKEYVLMQCTGLKDKNDKLIYEGDIIRFKDNITINGSKAHIAVIEHNEAFNAFMYHAECMGLYTVNKAQNEKFNVEVIGNIYENKELLNEI